ncbi:tyrosinase family protein [Pseudonocardia lacus]|uniref:tyrosinase family protein n=1 Tax=Pseudonocardia lacus TaxID=2835865 RepID=UPI0027E28EFB|nr:tyrosinase family protein [Pseudonocardia lacus]
MIRTRQDIAGLTLGDAAKAATQQWHPVLDTYARGVELMKALPASDPRSWLWAANTHGIPPGTPPRPTWNQCTHQSVFFLPWHRAYLAWFEETIRDLTGDPDWALPYWDYTVPGTRADRTVPVEFSVRTRTVAANVVPNPLFAPNRDAGPIPIGDVGIVDALADPRFVRSFLPGFGGADPDRRTGHVENLPHNFVHNDIGGLMGSPATAGRDPIFWLHHSNIDRLWEVWSGLPGSVPPTAPGAASALLVAQWRSAVFVFGDPASPATYTMDQVEDPTGFGYEYQVTELPADLADAVQEARAAAGAAVGVAPVDETEPEWEPIAATFNVTSGQDRDIPVAAGASATAAALTAGTTTPSGLVIELSGVRATDPHGVYVVEVRSAPDAGAHRAGRISTFGLAGTADEEERDYLVDATPILPDLLDEGWSGGTLSIRVVPEQGRADSDDVDKAIRVRQVTLYVPTA